VPNFQNPSGTHAQLRKGIGALQNILYGAGYAGITRKLRDDPATYGTGWANLKTFVEKGRAHDARVAALARLRDEWLEMCRALVQVAAERDAYAGVTFTDPRVIDCARRVREDLATHKLESFVKTTGGKGLHVVTPLAPGRSWEETSAFARGVAERLAASDPRRYTARMAKTERRGKIFIDYLRNVRSATSVAAYSTRATPQATVSVPIAWEELTPSLTSDHFTIANLPRRLAKFKADPWAGYWTASQAL
jgi:hypothetical protein